MTPRELLFSKADWIVPGLKVHIAGHDAERNVYLEAPIAEGNEPLSSKRNTLVGRRSFRTGLGHITPNTIIGRYCAFSANVFVGGGNHHMEWLTTGFVGDQHHTDALHEGQDDPWTIVGCDVWIGISAIVLGGRRVGHGACIGAGAVVTKDVAPFTIVAGNPARVIRQRFPDETIADLMQARWWELPHDIIERLPIKDVQRSLELVHEYRRNGVLPK
jgi:acetyltransferase-like isoleucine patch superfamily enzyme